ncbi:MAG TPA: EAL domain-containing protein [Terriglobia bacterium]|nr:EAL domain-containing protein [Terriglobia bacterium]
MLTLLDTILKPGSLMPVFQPIFEIHGEERELHYLECLMRGPKGTSVERADILFGYVRRKREEISVDRACMRAALQATSMLPFEPNISVNVHASTLGRDAGFVSYLKGLADDWGITSNRLTVELIEHAPFWDVAGIWRAIDELRSYGMRLAVDDVGAGQSNYNMILDCCPDALKVDAYVVRGCHADKHRVAVLESITTLARRFGAQIIAEGIEEAADLEVLLGMGINLIQGYMLARPMTIQNLLQSGLLRANEARTMAMASGAQIEASMETTRS